MSHSSKFHVAAALLFLALTVGVTWPLVPNLGRAVSDPGDPFIVTWILDWDYHATFTQPLSLFHANIFHPARYTLAFTEHLYGIAMLLFPLRLMGVGPVAAYNVAFLLGIALCGFGAYLLGWRLTGSWIAGMAAGIFYAFVPFRFVHLAHLQHAWGGWLPLMLFALLEYAGRPTRRRAVVFAALFVMNGLANIHYLLFGALATAVTAAILIPRAHWREILLATLAALVVLAPFLYPYAAASKLYGLERSADEVRLYSATPSDWLPGQTEPERKLFPGYLAYVFLAAALAVVRPRNQLLVPLLWIAIGFLGSLGLNFFFHEFLYGGVPGFKAIRVPARWAVIAYIGMAILVALTTVRMRRFALLAPLVLLVELWAGPIRWYVIDPNPNPVYRWLAQQKVSAIAELPIDSIASDYEYMLRATAHHKPMINGVSGFAPPLRLELSHLSKQVPIPDAFVDKLLEAGVELVIVHGDELGGSSEAVRAWLRRELDRGRLGFVRSFDSRAEGDWVFSLKKKGGRERVEGFLIGVPTCGSGTMGGLNFPPAGIRFDKGQGLFAGWVVSRHGIRSVDLWFDNRTFRARANVMPDPNFTTRCAGVPNVTRASFLAEFAKRPDGIRPETDVQVIVTDGRGVQTVFDDRWIRWD